MDKQGVGKDIWTSSQNAQLDHIPKPLTLTYPQGFAFGLSRFACQQPFEIKAIDAEHQNRKPGQRRPVAYENGYSLN
jgi:hypothetical protein